MKQIVHENKDKTLAISTVSLDLIVLGLDSLTGFNQEQMPFESMVFNLVDGYPNFENPIEHRHYNTEADAIQGHQELIKKYDPNFIPPLDN